MASDPITQWVRDVLVRHDPVGAYRGAEGPPHDYSVDAAVVAGTLRNTLGLGHIFTVIADRIDATCPGFYSATRDDDQVRIAVGRAARELWDGRLERFGIRLGQAREPIGVAGPPPADIPAPPSADDMPANVTVLSDWLRQVENGLATEPAPYTNPGPWTLTLRDVLPDIVSAYAAATNTKREAMRVAVSRFSRTLHQLSGFVARTLTTIGSDGGEAALRLGLMGESLLDMRTDYRDEMLVLGDTRRNATAAGLPFIALLEEAAAASGPQTATFLRNLMSDD